MRKINGTACADGKFALSQLFIYSLFITIIISFTACQKSGLMLEMKSPDMNQPGKINSSANPVNFYQDISFKTQRELQLARDATAKYQRVENAVADGYTQIPVDVENMGHHYMKLSLVDDKFEISKPELLVYNKDESGKQQLVAVEYAIPLNNTKPEGFTGSADVWDGNTTFGLWLLHAWVWEYNPDGVFNPLNPLVHLH